MWIQTKLYWPSLRSTLRNKTTSPWPRRGISQRLKSMDHFCSLNLSWIQMYHWHRIISQSPSVGIRTTSSKHHHSRFQTTHLSKGPLNLSFSNYRKLRENLPYKICQIKLPPKTPGRKFTTSSWLVVTLNQLMLYWSQQARYSRLARCRPRAKRW